MKRFVIFALLFGLYACGPLDDTPGSSTGTISTDGGCSDTWSGYGSSFFSTSCAGGCHGGQYANQSSVKAAQSRISSEISSGRMPQGGSLSASSKSRILTYLSCGVP